MSSNELTMTVAELVCSKPSRARIFEQYGIDYCCGGQVSLADACASRGADAESVVQALREADAGAPAEEIDWSKETMSGLVDHILEAHHAYLREELPRLSEMTRKVAEVHGEKHGELGEVRTVFAALRNELEQHMMKEEQILFPMIKQIESVGSASAGMNGGMHHCGAIESPIQVMEHEHDNAGAALSRLRDLTGGFAVPEDACGTYRVMLDGLAHLESDLHQHIHKENNILFPRAIAATDA